MFLSLLSCFSVPVFCLSLQDVQSNKSPLKKVERAAGKCDIMKSFISNHTMLRFGCFVMNGGKIFFHFDFVRMTLG